jgi:hypothetical protein
MSEPSITKSTEEGLRVNEAVAGRKIRCLPGEASTPMRSEQSESALAGNGYRESRGVSRGHSSGFASVKARTQRRDADQAVCTRALSPSSGRDGVRQSAEPIPEGDSPFDRWVNFHYPNG